MEGGALNSTCNHNRIPYFPSNTSKTTIDPQEPLTHTGKTRRELEWKAYKAYTKKFYGNGSRPGDSVPEKHSIEKRIDFRFLLLHPLLRNPLQERLFLIPPNFFS